MYKIILLPLFLACSTSLPSSFLSSLEKLTPPEPAREIQQLEEHILKELDSIKNNRKSPMQ